MSGLLDLCRTLETVNRDADDLAAELGQRAQRLAQSAIQAATLGHASKRVEGAQTAQALQAASTSVQQAAQLLHQVAVEGRGFVSRHAGAQADRAAGHVAPIADAPISRLGEGEGKDIPPGTQDEVGELNLESTESRIVSAGVHTLPGLPEGCVMVPLDLIDQTENPINGPQDFGKGYSIEDLAHAFDLLESRILPDLANGVDPSSFAAQDQAYGKYGTRSLADTYSGFLNQSSGNVIKLELKPDGTYSISNGRHRIYVAGQIDRQYVPAFISGRAP